MKRQWSTILLFVFCCLSPLLVFAGGQEAATEDAPEVPVNPAGVFPIVDQRISLSFYMEGNPTDQGYKELEENNALRFIMDKLNIDMDVTLLNSAEGKTKMILSFASGDYPDASLLSWNTMFSRDDLVQYGMKERFLLPLNEYIDEYSIELKKIFDRIIVLESIHTTDFGSWKTGC